MYTPSSPLLSSPPPDHNEHGGNLYAAQERYRNTSCVHYKGTDTDEDWLDLSTGINPVAYPVPDNIPVRCWTDLPQMHERLALEAAARSAYKCNATHHIVAATGTSAIIQHLPRILDADVSVAIVAPTYTGHQTAFTDAGWTSVRLIAHPKDAFAHEGLVVVHPNNPDGRTWSRAQLGTHPFIIVDESFADTFSTPEASLSGYSDLIVLRSFGKFYGLAGVRLGFALCPAHIADKLHRVMGPWPVSGFALYIGCAALHDRAWATHTRQRLKEEACRLDAVVLNHRRIDLVGGTSLFRLYHTQNAAALQDHLARHRIWTRIFSYNPAWIRLGVIHRQADLTRFKEAIACY